MDTLTHALSGALVGRVLAAPHRRLTTGAAVLGGFAAGAFPDSDVLLRAFTDPLTFLNWHRGLTHSLLMLPLWALLLSALFARITRGRIPPRAWFGLASAALLIHIGADVITSYGTQILAPLSDYKASWPTTFIIDPWFTGILLLGLLASRLWRRSKWPAASALVVLAGYVSMQAVLMIEAEQYGRDHVRSKGIAATEVKALAQPLSPFNWKVIAEGPAGYRVAHISLWRDKAPESPAPNASLFSRVSALYRPPEQARWRAIPKFGEGAAASLGRSAWEQPGFAGFRAFARYPFVHKVTSESPVCVWFSDLRFTAADLRVPFRFGMCHQSGGDWELYRLREDGAERIE